MTANIFVWAGVNFRSEAEEVNAILAHAVAISLFRVAPLHAHEMASSQIGWYRELSFAPCGAKLFIIVRSDFCAYYE